jgi:hypothetical protein
VISGDVAQPDRLVDLGQVSCETNEHALIGDPGTVIT